jgi:NAD(P)-dependent dehydrogenase (short-subunit alcohol dehydrogenase family)
VDPEGRVAVVTGGASGIGAALARALAAAGAAGVVVCDLDEAGARAVAGGLPAPALGVGADAADEAAIARVVHEAEERFGPVDVFCANAGVAVGEGLGEEAEWDRALGVHVRGHVRAARLLVPGWLERGEGLFLATASAAGLLSQIGSAPYAVTKHATVAFAEWLAITYGERGVQVACLCPLGVDTPMIVGDSPMLETVRRSGAVLTPDAVAAAALDAVRARRFLVLPHPEVQEYRAQKVARPERWIAGMQRLQASVGWAP